MRRLAASFLFALPRCGAAVARARSHASVARPQMRRTAAPLFGAAAHVHAHGERHRGSRNAIAVRARCALERAICEEWAAADASALLRAIA